MKLSAITPTLGLSLVLFGSVPAFAARDKGDLVQLRVSVFNTSPISSSIIQRAEGEAGRVLRDVGVEVIWLNCPQDAKHEASLVGSLFPLTSSFAHPPSVPRPEDVHGRNIIFSGRR